MSASASAARFLTYSAAGWGLERFWRGKAPQSALWQKQQVPLLPIYGLGALMVLGMAPHIDRSNMLVRFGAYAAALTGLEWASCRLGRELYGWVGWNYEDGACIDVPHALAWGALGVALERIDPKLFGDRHG